MDLFNLYPPERLKRFHELAEEAREAAKAADSAEHGQDFLRIAARWEMMAAELEAIAARYPASE